MVGLKQASRHLGLGELGHGLGGLGHGVLGELTGEDKADSGLDVLAAHGLSLGVADEATGFGGDLLEGVHAEGVEDSHALLGEAHLRVDLLQDLVDVGLVRLLGLALLDDFFRHGEIGFK